ncbi:nitrilase 3 [Colletotrichum liriopes]|uniref:Nitrilase 3 n=1 Tax=Colletotrichum liriopes TaxID=708192 RepID=A0AA37GX30_9PEZI|nr:nitrilase 3 [Colletotrichum liriopes]
MASTRPIVKVAAVQAAPVSFDLEKSLQKLRRQWFAKYLDSAVEVPSPAFERLSETARANNVLLQVGIIEKAGGTLYCTALLLDREGKMVYKHRKVMPPTT